MEPDTHETWFETIRQAFITQPRPLETVKEALRADPAHATFLHLACLAALVEEDPRVFFQMQKRLLRRYDPILADQLLLAIGHAQSGQWSLAAAVLARHGLARVQVQRIARGMWEGFQVDQWALKWFEAIRRQARGTPAGVSAPTARERKPPPPVAAPTPTERKNRSAPTTTPIPAEAPELAEFPPLPRMEVRIPVHFAWPDPAALVPPTSPEPALPWFVLREELIQLGLLQGFDELLCLPHLRQVETYWYQVETVRKVLKRFRGRVLLADEVGLGKTIEAGMILKEYLLRGMAARVLILTPASLVGQWREEMAVKFGIDFATTQEASFRNDPEAFWKLPRVIASLAVARREEQTRHLTGQGYDLVIVDEAHHLRNRTTRNWKLVDALDKRFLVLLTATPVQNSLLDLYNLLTLLKPGLFQTEKEFRASHVSPRNPRLPANEERLRELMRDVMIRNTRALVDVRLPPRQAVTLRVAGTPEEHACYHDLSQAIRERVARGVSPQHRMTFHHLLTAAGSSVAAVAAMLGRLAERQPEDETWPGLRDRLRAIPQGGKEKALLEVISRNPEEKKLIFVHHRDSFARLEEALTAAGWTHARFEGGMSGPAKDAAVADFRERVPILLCGESGGEGRNLQFCNTIVNFDLPWSPMVIEQRIGRIHRIGQTREVFVFNLALRDSVEDRLLALLDEKLNLFELVVGEVDVILGEMDEGGEFAETVFSAWVETTEERRVSAFAAMEERILAARGQYHDVRQWDERLFGDEFEA